MIDLSIAIQHHPTRAELLPELIERIGECEVVTDPEPRGRKRPLRTYRLALETTPATATHRLIVQDDTRPVRGFRARAEEAIAEHPDAIVCFFVSGSLPDRRLQLQKAHERGDRWYSMVRPGWVPTVATAWPRERVEQFIAYLEANEERHRKVDDGAAGSFCKSLDPYPEVWATVPSLVEHPDVAASIMGKTARAGANRSRIASVFVDD